MPTFDALDSFWRDFRRLTPDQRTLLKIAAAKLRADLPTGRFRPGLRVKGVQGKPGLFEMTWAPDGRATFRFGPQIHAGEPHIIWERCGTHDIFDE